MNTIEFSMAIRGKDDKELKNMRRNILIYLLGLGADPDKICTLCAIDAELTVRDMKQKIEKDLGLA